MREYEPKRGQLIIHHGKGDKDRSDKLLQSMIDTESQPETVTVVDPRHPLVGRTFRLIEIANKPYFGYACLVAFRGPVERHIPVCVTDLAAEPPVIFPLPLNLASVQQLVATYERICCQRAEGTEDELPATTCRPKRLRICHRKRSGCCSTRNNGSTSSKRWSGSAANCCRRRWPKPRRLRWSMLSSQKILSSHLERWACVYVRQSTARQVRQNQESQVNQYLLIQRAEAFGWPQPRIRVIDSDLGLSGRRAPVGLAFRNWWPRYPWAKWASSSVMKSRGLPATTATGIICWIWRPSSGP